MRLALLLLAAAVNPALAADSKPEITRDAVTPQAVGAPHSVRTIPEACARLEGMFTGEAAQPYKFAAVRTSPKCQPRARFVDAAKATPSEQAGWRLNDLIRIPNAACPGQIAAVRVWRKPVEVAPPGLDAQGRSRIYLADARAKSAAATQPPEVTLFAAEMAVEGAACGG
ncbi:MAG: hypothetical protein H0W24_01190 [Lysobacter sp.]|jgi:hypothetical protein|nr:hypothetical protein [Lysobacter sp.]MDQ3269375.1 hypothetical protein [Pseudomonadota bacterium]